MPSVLGLGCRGSDHRRSRPGCRGRCQESRFERWRNEDRSGIRPGRTGRSIGTAPVDARGLSHHDHSRDRRRRLHRFARRGGPAGPGRKRPRHRQSQRLLLGGAERGAAGPLAGPSRLPLRQGRHRRPRDGGRAVAAIPGRHRGGASGRAGRGALFAGKPLRLHRRQRDRAGRPVGGGAPHAQAGAFRLRLDLLGLRHQQKNALLGRGPGRQPDVDLRRDQEGGGDDGLLLQPPLRHAGDGPALLHGVRPLGAPRHGGLSVRRRDHRRAPDPRVQRRQDEARLHLRRGHRRRRAGRAGPPGAAEQPDQRAPPGLQPRQQPVRGF